MIYFEGMRKFYHYDLGTSVHNDIHQPVTELTKTALEDFSEENRKALMDKLLELGTDAFRGGLTGEALMRHQLAAAKPYNDAVLSAEKQVLLISVYKIIPQEAQQV